MAENGHSPKNRLDDYPDARSTGGPSDGAPEAVGPDALKRALEQLGELREYAAYYIGVKLDQIKLTLRNALIYAALGVVAGIAGIVAICIAVSQVLQGIALGIGRLLDGHLWAGYLITGALVLTLVAITVVVVMSKITSASKAATLRKYELRKQQQKHDFGRDVQQAAHGEPRP